MGESQLCGVHACPGPEQVVAGDKALWAHELQHTHLGWQCWC